MVEKQIIKLFCEDRELYNKYYKYININYIKINYNNIYKIFIIINNYYNKYNNNNITIEELDVAFNANYLLNEAERKEITALITEIFKQEIKNPDIVLELLEEHRKRSLSGEIARVALEVEDGQASFEDLNKLYEQFDRSEIIADEVSFVNMNLKELLEKRVTTPGLRWRLNFLNKSLGSLRKGNFGFIFARPETGKTTFLASEITHMIKQTDGDILWFNNEEDSGNVALRVFQAMDGVTLDDMKLNFDSIQKSFDSQGGQRIHIVDKMEDASRASRIEAKIKETTPALIIFDQIDKIKGFKADRYDLELKAIYQWARELAKEYAPVIAVSQASGEAEHKLWLTMDVVDSSKTSKQGEADWMLGIGKEQDNTSRFRYFNIVKNKLTGDEDTLPELRHGQAQVLIKPEVARYEDL